MDEDKMIMYLIDKQKRIIKILELLNEGLENSFREPDKAYIYHGKIKQKIDDLKDSK